MINKLPRVFDKIKLYNSLLLIILFIVFQMCFSFVLKDLHVFKKAEESASLLYEFSISKFIIIFFIVAFLIYSNLVLKMKGFLYIITVLVLIFFVFPSAILFSNIRDLDYRIFLSHSLFFTIIMIIGKIKIKIESKTLNLKQSKNVLLYGILVGMIPFFVLYFPHINFNNLLLKEIYETREQIISSVDNFYTNYTYSWFNKTLIPCLVVFCLFFKKKQELIVAIGLLVFLFLCGAHKAVFVGLFMVLILYKYNYKKKANYFIKFMISVSLISLIISVVFNNNFLMVMSIRRTVFLPSLLDILYFNFFEENHLYWSETFNGVFFNYPYKHPHAFIIGEKYFGTIIWNANNGVISDGFMNFGMLGVFINSILIALYFSFLNQLNISSKFFGIFFLLFFVIISSSLTTVMLTHGGILLLFVSFFILKNSQSKMNDL